MSSLAQGSGLSEYFPNTVVLRVLEYERPTHDVRQGALRRCELARLAERRLQTGLVVACLHRAPGGGAL